MLGKLLTHLLYSTQTYTVYFKERNLGVEWCLDGILEWCHRNENVLKSDECVYVARLVTCNIQYTLYKGNNKITEHRAIL